MTSIVVGMVDLRRALASVVPHVDPDPDSTLLHRLHCIVGLENLTVCATQRCTVGNAIVSIEDNAAGDMVAFDLLPVEAKQILDLFKPPKVKGVNPMEQLLRLDIEEKQLTVTDIAGLFAGKALTLPRIPLDEQYPDLQIVLRKRLAAAATPTDRLITNGHMVGLFTVASRVYSEPLVIEPTGSRTSMTFSCGESFVGLLMPTAVDEEKTQQINAWHSDWLTRLGDDTGYDPREGS